MQMLDASLCAAAWAIFVIFIKFTRPSSSLPASCRKSDNRLEGCIQQPLFTEHKQIFPGISHTLLFPHFSPDIVHDLLNTL